MISRMATLALSPTRLPARMMRVYPPARSPNLGAISLKSFWVTAGSKRYEAAWRRDCSVSRLPRVIIFSATGRAALARVSVVVMRPCWSRLVTRLRKTARRWSGCLPSFDPELRCRMVFPFTFLQGRSAPRQFKLRRACSSAAPLQNTSTNGSKDPPLQAATDGVFGGRRGGLAGERRPDDAAVLIELHAQRKAHLDENFLDLVERLAAEVLGLEHFVFALLHELADGLDIRVLQAVVGAHGKLELLDGAVQMLEARIVRSVRRSFDGFHGLFEVDEDAHMILHQLGGVADAILRRDGAVGPDFHHQLFVVGHLAETSGFDGVVDLAHRRVHAVHGNVANRQILVVVAVCSDVTAAVLRAHFDLELPTFADRGDVDALVEHGKVRVFLDVRRGDRAGLLDVEIDRLGQIGVQLDGHLLEIEDDVRGVLDHAGNRREFVQDAFDLHGGDGRALDGTEQRTAQSVTDGGAPSALKRLRGEAPVLLGKGLEIRREVLRLLKTFPHLCSFFLRPTSVAAKN